MEAGEGGGGGIICMRVMASMAAQRGLFSVCEKEKSIGNLFEIQVWEQGNVLMKEEINRETFLA